MRRITGTLRALLLYFYDNISFRSSQNEKRLRKKLQRKSKLVLYPITFLFPKIVSFMTYVRKNATARHTTEDNTAHGHSMLGN